MATAEEILQTMAEVPESAPVCVIDPETRTIIVPPDYQLFGVENDKRTERLYFQCPKIVGDNQDLSRNYQLFINYQNANGEPDAYHIEDMEVDGDNITFSWLLEENVTKYRGNIQFAFGAIIPGDETEDPDKNRWNTTINTECTCLVGLKCTQQVAESNPDALVQIWAAIDELKAGGGSGTGGTTNYNNLSNKPRLNGVTLEGNKTLDQVGVLAKNQGASNSGKYLSVGSDGNVVPADAPSGGTVDPEQIKQAVNGYLEENPVSGMTAEQEQQLNQNTSDVADLKSALEQIGSSVPDGSISPEKTTFMTLKAGEGSNANLLNPSLLVPGGYYNSDKEFDDTGELNGTNGGYRYIFTKSNGNINFTNVYNTSPANTQNNVIVFKEPNILNVISGKTYCLQADKVINNSYVNPNLDYVLLYDNEGVFIKSLNFTSTADYIYCTFTPETDGYILFTLRSTANLEEKTVNAYTNYMFSENSGYVNYEEYGSSTGQTLDITDEYKEGFVKNLMGIERDDSMVCFSECEKENTDGVIEESTEHIKNATKTLLMKTLQTGVEYSVAFKNINMNVSDDNFGIWFWISRLDKGCTQGASTETKTYATVKIKINSDYEKTFTKSALKSGLNYYLIESASIPSKKVSSVTITLSAASGGQNVSIYLDSIERGYKSTPHVLINMDCSPKQLMTDKGYELLTKYDLTGTFDYHAFPNGGNSGTWNDESEAKTHMQLIAEGFDYGIYSQYKADSETTGQPQYYDTDYDKWYDHAVTMYESNNTLGIFAPTTVHSNFHYAGDAYERAMVDAGFLIVRTDNIMWDNAGSYKDCLFSYFDKDDYREIVPYWLQGVYTEDDNVAKAKELIDLAISRGQNVMICCHSIKDSEYDGSSDNTNVGENAMDPLFAYIKEKVDAGEIKCSTSADFIRDVAPDLYSWWNNKKNDLQYNYVINKIVT